MHISTNRYPLDLLICIFWSIVVLPTVLLNLNEPIRIILGLPFILFIPGYLLLFVLFPKRNDDRGITVSERLILSFGLSIALVSLIGFALNYTPWGIHLESVLLSLLFYVLAMGAIALIRWYRTPINERFIVQLSLTLPQTGTTIDKALTIILSITILLAVTFLVYILVTPKQGEHFTEFYILGPSNTAASYPRNLHEGENTTILIGIVNHEYQLMNYTVDIWLINQSIITNESENQSYILIHNMWFLNKITTTLDHFPIDIETTWQPQWEHNFTFRPEHNGSFKLMFLLYTTPTAPYEPGNDYMTIAQDQLGEAYRSLHLYVTVD